METSFDRYSKNILEMLLKSNSPLTAGEIAEKINISSRMVRYRLSPLNEWVEKRGGNICIKPNFGINLEISPSKKNHLLSELSKEIIVEKTMLPEDRQDFIKLLLLICDSPITSKQIKFELGISRVTILKDLDCVQKWFNEKNLHLVRKPGYGIKIQGEEANIRNAIVEYLVNKLGGLSLAKLCRGSSALQSTKSLKKLHRKVKSSLIGYLNTLDLSYTWQLTNQVENGLNCQLSENSYIIVVLYLAILIDRLRRKATIINFYRESHFQQQNEEYYIAKIIADKIHYRYGVDITNAEVDFITKILSGLETKKTISDTIGDIKKRQITQEADILTKKILSDVSIFLHPYLFVDPNLYWELSNHIQTLLNSLRIPVLFRKDIYNQIKTDSPHIFSIAQKAVKHIENAIGLELPETEIGYLSILLISAMERICPPHRIIRNVIIVNDGGYETTALLKSRLSSNIPEIEVVDCIGPLEMLEKKLSESEFDAIITTLDLENTNIPRILVSPLLTDANILKIKETLNITSKSHKDTLATLSSLHLWNLLSIESIDLDVEAYDWQEVVELSGLLLLNIGAIYPRYINAMKELILENGPYVVSGPGIALLHARPDQGAKRTCLSLIRLKKPVNFGHVENDPVDLVFALSAADSIPPQTALFEFVDLINNNQALKNMRKASSKGEIISVLQNLGN